MRRSMLACRPRVEGDREDEILEGVLQVLTDIGYDKLSFDTIATHVRASKATLYRKWPTKVDLVISALDQLAICPLGGSEVPDSGSLIGDLEQLTCSDPEWTRRLPGIVRAIVPALHRDPDLTLAFNEHFMKPRQQLMITVLERAKVRGEIGNDADLGLLSQIVPALMIHHTMISGNGPDSEQMRTIITGVLLPACLATTESPNEMATASSAARRDNDV